MIFKDFDFSNFWWDCECSVKNYISASPSDDEIQKTEKELGYKLPESYIELMKMHNGGMIMNDCFPMSVPTSWADDHIMIEGFFGIGSEKSCSLCGTMGQRLWVDEWEYPNYGVYISETPTGGHQMLLLDYRKCGKDGEPEVAYVDQEDNYKITFVAKDFETFVRGLVSGETFDSNEEDDNFADVECILSGEMFENEDFKTFVRGLVSGEMFENEDEED